MAEARHSRERGNPELDAGIDGVNGGVIPANVGIQVPWEEWKGCGFQKNSGLDFGRGNDRRCLECETVPGFPRSRE